MIQLKMGKAGKRDHSTMLNRIVVCAPSKYCNNFVLLMILSLYSSRELQVGLRKTTHMRLSEESTIK